MFPKIDFQIGYKKCDSQLKDSVTRQKTGEPIAKLEIDDKLYVIFPKGNWSHKNPCLSGLKQGIVGELTVNSRRYIVVDQKETVNKYDDNKAENLTGVLTKRELQIVMLVAEGRANKQIARYLKISEWTVSTHLRRIFAKLNVDSRAAMVYRCLDQINKKDLKSRDIQGKEDGISA